MATGAVSFYNQAKGFGLIKPDTGGPAVFMHQSALASPNAKVRPTQRVEFDLVETASGFAASRVRLLA